MCLAIPGKIVAIDGDVGVIDFGGTKKEANISMVDAKVGDWAIVHAGFAIELMDEAEAEETVELWNDFLSSGEADIRKPK
ncbi:HypC/HybG/HupF family hydrogenase formation chaperone [Methanomassiliicoccaceae archaeon COG_1]|nr:HypC/HybG/HupF family hydrogenase formation chaperone [Methanomassiliicoccaceae archaeon COG_1]